MTNLTPVNETQLANDIENLIETAKKHIYREANDTQLKLYWAIGQRIELEVLKTNRADYGEQIVKNLAMRLTTKYGKGYGIRNVQRMIQFFRYYPDQAIASSLMTQLSWTHFVYLITIIEPLKRDFYAEMCRIERWSTRELIQKMQSMLYERVGLAKKPEKIIEAELKKLRATGELTTDYVVQDPIILGHLVGKQFPTEYSFEQAILDDIESFLLSLGNGFAFLERQKQIEIDGIFHRIDLLMYHRRLRCLVVVELKMGRFHSQDKGQLELYLRWLERYEKQPNENPPIGILLCSEKSDETVELLKLDGTGIHVSQFLTELPSKQVLTERLHAAIEKARARQEFLDALDLQNLPEDK